MAIDAVSEVIDLYKTDVAQATPWSKLRETTKNLGQFGAGLSVQNANRVGNIKTELMNTIDAYDSAAQSVYEWCGFASSTLSTYIHLSSSPNPAVRATQKNLLIRVLDEGLAHMAKAQKALANSSSGLRSASTELTTLVDQLRSDYSANGEYFKKRVDELVKEKNSSFWSIFRRQKTIENEAIHEVEEKIRSILAQYDNEREIVYQTLQHLDQSTTALNGKIQTAAERKTQASASNANDASGNLNAIVESAKSLIAKCQEFRQNHA